jgi:hypothetical protein
MVETDKCNLKLFQLKIKQRSQFGMKIVPLLLGTTELTKG